tara:strand:- start:2899 stop:3654 length:756 start_codon:yes stop_codon:yes gene_type:complete
MNRYAYTLLPLALLFSAYSHAEFQQVSVNNLGDKRATLDKDTGIEWLDTNLTKGESFTSLSERLTKGGDLYGWRLPTKNEVFTMLDNYFSASYQGVFDTGVPVTDSTGVNFSSSKNTHVALYFINTFGQENSITPSNYTYKQAKIRFKDGSGNAEYINIYHSKYTSTASGRRVKDVRIRTYEQDDPNGTYANSSYGYFLVSDGGVTLDSINNPELNENNPNSPYNVPVPVWGVACFGALLLLRNRKSNPAT